MLLRKPTKTLLWGKSVTIEPNADGQYPCPAEECGLLMSKGNLKAHIRRFHTEVPDAESQAEPSPRGRTQTLRQTGHPYPSTGRRSSRPYTSSPLGRSTSPLDVEVEDDPASPMVLGLTQWPAAPTPVVATPGDPPGRTINSETLPVSVKQSKALDVFDLVVMQPYGLLVCVSCGWGFGHNHASGHLSKAHQNNGLTKEIVTKLVNRFNLRTHAELVACKPKGIVPAFELLRTLPGLACTGCDFVTVNTDEMAKHLSNHPKESAVSEVATLQLFLPAQHSGYIHVRPAEPTSTKSTSDLVDEAMALDRETYEPALIDNTDWRSIHPFLEISGWSVWIGSMTRKQVDALRVHLKASDELISDCRTLVQTMWKCCTAENYSARCHINSETLVD